MGTSGLSPPGMTLVGLPALTAPELIMFSAAIVAVAVQLKNCVLPLCTEKHFHSAQGLQCSQRLQQAQLHISAHASPLLLRHHLPSDHDENQI